MSKLSKLAIVIGSGLALASWAAAQTPAGKPAAAPAAEAATPAVVPVDQQPTKEQLAKLFELTQVNKQLASVTKMMPAFIQRQMTAQMAQLRKDHPEIASANEDQERAITKAMDKLIEGTTNLYSSDEMIADMTGLYQKYLTRSDVDGMIDFYGSPAGQHMLSQVPVIMKEFMPLVAQRMNERSKPLMDEFAKEVEGITQPKTPAADKPAAN
jgi:hypothetical protein